MYRSHTGRLARRLAVAALCVAWPAVAAGPAPSPQPATAAEVLAAVRAADAKAVLVNVWATWCIPCREEFPDLLRLRRAYANQGLNVLFVSGDFASERNAATTFLTEQGVDFPTYIKTGDDMQFIDAFDQQWSGALPATFIYDHTGTRRHALLGKSSYAQFEEKVRDVLKK